MPAFEENIWFFYFWRGLDGRHYFQLDVAVADENEQQTTEEEGPVVAATVFAAGWAKVYSDFLGILIAASRLLQQAAQHVLQSFPLLLTTYRSHFIDFLCQAELISNCTHLLCTYLSYKQSGQTNTSLHQGLCIHFMRRDIPRGRPTENPRRSSVHFTYESEEPSPLPLRDDSPPSSPSPALTVKTNHIPSLADSLSAFDLPIFQALTVDSRRKHPQENQNRSEQEQFWTFLENFGRQGESEETPDFEEEATVYCRHSTTDQRKDSRQADSRIPQMREPIRESNREEEGHDGTPPNGQGRRTYAVAATQTVTPLRKKKQPQIKDSEWKRMEEHYKQKLSEQMIHISCAKNLTFKELPPVELSEERRYPLRVTRELGRLKYWQGERIDYVNGGYWVQKAKEQ